MQFAQITGWGKCVPPAVLSNQDLETFMETTDEWITTRTGIRERRICHCNFSDMARGHRPDSARQSYGRFFLPQHRLHDC